MKYFTKDLWLSLNDKGTLDFATAMEKGRANWHDYVDQLEKLRPCLSEKAYRFFKKENLQYARLLAFLVGDNLEQAVLGRKPARRHTRASSVMMKVLTDGYDVVYTLKYTKVRKAIFDSPSSEPLFWTEGGQIGDWGYDELTRTDDYLRHEILFASGTTITIEFKHFSFQKEKCDPSLYRNRLWPHYKGCPRA
jgi:hypothetical protein